MSQGIGRPEERERDGGTVGQWSSQSAHIYQLSSLSCVDAVHGLPRQLQRSLITGHHNNNNEKVGNIARITKM